MDKKIIREPVRGMERILEPLYIPMIDKNAVIGYTGSISKKGDNADWDWYLYKTENDEWVIFESYGPGCIYNLTQHRYPSSPEPVFRFYIDDEEKASLEIPHSGFGKAGAFSSPLSDRYIGPEDGGRGPIRVVRSFLPFGFSKHCVVTSSVKLEGCEKSRGEGGWGHITYHSFSSVKKPFSIPDPETIKYSNEYLKKSLENEDSGLFEHIKTAESFVHEGLGLQPGESKEIFRDASEGTIVSVSLKTDDFDPKMLSDIRIQMTWDGHADPDVRAVLGTFFGNEYGELAAKLQTLFLRASFCPGGEGDFYCRFPMPYWKSASITISNDGSKSYKIKKLSVRRIPSSILAYDKKRTGYFKSSRYYGPRENIKGNNSIIADIRGTGHMVYGTISGKGILRGGCEGDVRIFIDGKGHPSVESDGSESWASYGWGFVTPPQCNPFSAYNGAEGKNSDWSQVRLTVSDSYHFLESLRFELEHGDMNDGMGSHSGQIFYYAEENEKTSLLQTDELVIGDLSSEKEHCYMISGKHRRYPMTSAFANGINDENSFKALVCEIYEGYSSFDVALDSGNKGVALHRLSSQEKGMQCACVYVDGVLVKERFWFFADRNPYYKWLEDEFRIPEKYTKRKNNLNICIEPVSIAGSYSWNESKYKVYSIM